MRPFLRFFRLALLGIAAAALLTAGNSYAQSFSGKTVRIIVPFAPGGTSDILARALANKLGEGLGSTVIVDNKPGANGVLGSDLVAKSAPDGLTLLLSDVGGLTTGPALGAKYPFDAQKDFAPITMIAYSPHLVVVANSVPVKTLAELVAASKGKAGGFSAATSGAGSAPHLAAALFAKRVAVDWVFIPYKGGAQAITDVIAGHAHILFNGMLATMPAVKANQLRLLAVSSDTRWPTLPDVPTVAESGYPGFITGSWQGLVAAANTPPDIVAKLNAELIRVMRSPEVRERVRGQYFDPYTSTPEEFAAVIKTDLEKWGKIVRASGARID